MKFNFSKTAASVAALFLSTGLVFLGGCCDDCESKCESCSEGGTVSTTVESAPVQVQSSAVAPAPINEQPISTSYDSVTGQPVQSTTTTTTTTAGGAVQSASNTASGAVNSASNTAGNAVQGAGNAASNAVDSAVKAPGKVLRGLGL